MTNKRTVKTSIRQSQGERELLEAIGKARGFESYSTFIRTVLGAYVLQMEMADKWNAYEEAPAR